MKKELFSLKNIVRWFLIVNCMLVAFGCGDSEGTVDNATPSCDGVSLTFLSDVAPVIQASCASSGCHNSGSRNGPGELLTFSQVYTARNEIYRAVSSGEMPQGSRLSTNEKSTILCWIQNGASN